MAKDDNTPNNLSELLTAIKDAARSFGFNDENGRFRNCITDNSSKDDSIRSAKDDDANFWFGFIREDEPEKSRYSGFSFVVFPERQDKGTRCVVSICIGSNSVGRDRDLASIPGFRRSFMRLTKKGESDAEFFFKLRFDDMETSTPGLQEKLETDSDGFDSVIQNTTTKYNADSAKDNPGMLPAAFIVDYTNKDGWKLIKAWLAQYAKWRSWEKHKNGENIKKYTTPLEEAIRECRVDLPCPKPDGILKLFESNRYIVLQGAPGCGKTWTANQIAGNKELFHDVVFTQFHAETTYADFVYGIKPVLNGKTLAYEGEQGTLLEAIDKAKNAPQGKKVLLIIDEINRANLANVLGPVFYLFEANNDDDAERTHPLKLGSTYKEGEKTPIEIEKLPKNLCVLATMNTADKSLAVVDFALRRRFIWVTLRPHKLDSDDFDSEFFDRIDELFTKYATDEELNLQPGQSYFKFKDKRKENIKYGLMPLFKEYFSEGFLLPAKEEFTQLLSTESHTFMYE